MAKKEKAPKEESTMVKDMARMMFVSLFIILLAFFILARLENLWVNYGLLN